jgi:uncharacterized protein with NRDE domain
MMILGPIGLLVGSLFSFVLCVYHHKVMNNLFVELRVPFYERKSYGTMSQTIIIVTNEGEINYFYRNTIEKKGNSIIWKKNSEWKKY